MESKKSLAMASARNVPGAKNVKDLLPSVLLNARDDTRVKPKVGENSRRSQGVDLRRPENAALQGFFDQQSVLTFLIGPNRSSAPSSPLHPRREILHTSGEDGGPALAQGINSLQLLPLKDHRKAGSTGRSMKVLIVDDTPLNLTLMQTLIGKLVDGEPVTFSDPRDAIEWCTTNQLDLLIVDYMMPIIDGIEFIKRFKAIPTHEDVPILMVTADHEKQTRYDALQGGATDFLNKPIDRHEFLPRVRNMLALRRAHLATRERARVLADEVAHATREILAREREMVTRLARAAEFRDPETGAHIQRMSHYSELIAARLGVDQEYQQAILLASPMHDVGKLGIPDSILLKPGRLTTEEFEIMKGHPKHGFDILNESSSPVIQLAASIALSHHERYDGAGYPRALAGEGIPLEGRIVAVADVFDALTSSRPYKKAWSLEDARAHLISGRGSHFDPACIDAFLGAWQQVLAIRERFGED